MVGQILLQSAPGVQAVGVSNGIPFGPGSTISGTAVTIGAPDSVPGEVLRRRLASRRAGTRRWRWSATAFTDEIHLLLTDVNMPLVDGLKAAAAVRSKRPGIKVIIMSGNTIETIRAENGPDAFLRKPFIPPTLLECVQRVLASKGPIDCEH